MSRRAGKARSPSSAEAVLDGGTHVIVEDSWFYFPEPHLRLTTRPALKVICFDYEIADFPVLKSVDIQSEDHWKREKSREEAAKWVPGLKRTRSGRAYGSSEPPSPKRRTPSE